MSVTRATTSKRRRIDRACDACRRRKTKCDGSAIPDNICSNCKQSHKKCTYVEESRPRGPPKAYITDLEDKVERLETLLKMLGPEIDLATELGPPIIRDSWKTEYQTAASSASTSSKATISPTKLSLKSNLWPQPMASISPSGGVPSSLYPDRKDHSRSSSYSASSSIIVTSPSHVSPDHRRSPSTSGSQDSWPDSDESDDESSPLGTGTRRLMMAPTEPAHSRNISMENPLIFVGKSSAYGLSCRVRKMRAGYMDEAVRDGVTREMSDNDDRIPQYNRPHRRMHFWTTPSWELAWGDSEPQFLPGLIAELPPSDLAHILTNLFFANVNIHFPLLHRPTFERQWREGLQFTDAWFSCLCLSVFAVASRWCDDARVLPHEDPSQPATDTSKKRNWRQAGSKYFAACLPMHEVHPSVATLACLFEVQAHAALAIFLRGTTDDALAWLTVSVGLRKAQDRGAHRKKVYGTTLSVDEEQWKRTVWILIVFDRLGSAHLGRPCCAREEDFDLDLPVEVDDEHWEIDNPSLAFQQPPGKSALVTSFNCFIKLSQIIAFTLGTLYAVDKSKLRIGVPRGPKWKEEVVMHLNTAMTEWVDSVPEHLRWSPGLPNENFANQAATLYTTYYLSQLLIYRPFILSPTISNDPSRPRVNPIAYADFPFPAQAICINAAKSCARIVDIQMKRGIVNVPNLIAVSHISAGTLLTNIWDLKAKERARQLALLEDVKPQHVQTIQSLLEDVTIFMNALEYAELRWDNAHMSLQTLKESLPGAVNESMLLRPMHVLDPIYPQLPTDFDWGPLTQGLKDDSRQAAPSIGTDVFQWDSTSPMPISPSMPYPQNEQRQTYMDVTSQPQWYDQQFNDFAADRRNSAQVPFISGSFVDDLSSQPPPRICGHSARTDANTQSTDIRWSTRGSQQIDGSAGGNRWRPFASANSLDNYWNSMLLDGSVYEPKGLPSIDGELIRGI